ncbi:MAG: hypothetical protein ACETV1_08850 [Candidatus Bathyarchaeia archaeon]
MKHNEILLHQGIVCSIAWYYLSQEKLEDARTELRVGDAYKCPEDHEAKIVWISEDKKVIAVRCPRRYFNKVAKVADHSKSPISIRRFRTKEKKVFVRNMVFLVRI